MTRRLTIILTARAVVAKGYEFSPRGGSFADADVALDEILNLPPPPEPLVLRVTATGGDAAERARVAGDWLCDAALGEPRRIPRPAWSYSEDATAWAKARPWLEAWETCQDARWMLHAAASVGVDRRLVVRAACVCARTVLDRVSEDDDRPRRAIETVEAWSRGQATLDQVQRAAATLHAYGAAAAAAYAADAANADDADDAADDAADAADAADRAADVATENTSTLRALATMAALVRGEIATFFVLRAATVT